MKGTDCTEAQVAHAKAFVEVHALHQAMPERFIIASDDLARLLAWYGALRFMSGRDGEGGTLECPGEIVIVEPEPAARLAEPKKAVKA